MKEFVIEKPCMSYEAYELKVPNSKLTSDILAVFACYDVSQDMKMVDYIYGVTAMSDDEIMAELDRISNNHYKPYYIVRKEYYSRFDGSCDGIKYMDEFGDEEQAREYATYLNANETAVTATEYTCYSIEVFNETDDEPLEIIGAEDLLPADEVETC